MKHPELCTREVVDGVAVLRFNRPDHLNGMTGNMEVAYYERLLEAESDPEIRAIVVTGTGRGWCPGADLATRPGPDDEPLPNTIMPTTIPLGIGLPIVAAINGACAGMGLALALQCDLRLAAPGVKFTTAFARRGLIAEYGLAWLLRDIAGRAVALDLLLSARVVRSEEMHELGLVNRIVDADELLDDAIRTARALGTESSPASIATIKHQLGRVATQTLPEAMAEADELMYESLTGADVAEGIASFLEKRPADFPPLGSGTRFGWMDDRDASAGKALEG